MMPFSRPGQHRTCAMLLLAAAVAVGSGSAFAQEFRRGQALYENHCKYCHEDWVHKRDGRKVSTINELRRRVAGWSVHSGLEWSDEEIGDVADYLAREFYHLEPGS